MAADSVEGADPGGFGKSTSVDPIVTGGETNLDRGKNSASLPPPFGSDGVNYPAADDPLTPGLAERSDAYASVASGTTPELPPLSEEPTSADTPGAPGVRFTPASAVTQADGSLGRLRIPAIGLDVRVWEGESLANLAKGVGHFSATSAWDGNVAVAGHNRGTAAWFAQLHTLKIGDRITYETCLGTRAYAVVSVARIAETDWSQLQASSENTLTLVTCVRDVPELRWCVQAREVA
jgi:sortase A